MSEKLEQLVRLSRTFGNDSQYVLLGGGNTSVKEGDVMYVKASGHALGSIDESGFVKMSLLSLDKIWSKSYPADDEQREDVVLADMMNCRYPGETARPSVEALLHSLMPFTYVVHMHPSMVNGLTCGQSGQMAVSVLFPDALWIPLVKPGYILALTVRDAMEAYAMEHDGAVPHIIFLQNHGVFVGADSPVQIDAYYEKIMKTISSHVIRRPNFTEVPIDEPHVRQVMAGIHLFAGADADIKFAMNVELQTKLQNKETFYPISSAFTPDHIVYSGFKPLWIGSDVFSQADPAQGVCDRCQLFLTEEGVRPKVVCVQDTGVFAVGSAALELFLDTVKVSVFTESFGSVKFMDDAMIAFIRNWEVEKYRSSVNK